MDLAGWNQHNIGYEALQKSHTLSRFIRVVQYGTVYQLRRRP